jgi:hypothetical protein
MASDQLAGRRRVGFAPWLGKMEGGQAVLVCVCVSRSLSGQGGGISIGETIGFPDEGLPRGDKPATEWSVNLRRGHMRLAFPRGRFR